MTIKEKITWRWNEFIKHHFPYLWSNKLHKKVLGRPSDLSHPHDLNEKIRWMMFFTDTSLWTTLADKYAVREYVKERIGEKYLVHLLGKWDLADDIDFNSLPDKFVMKPNNGSYDTVIVTDKSKANLNDIKEKMNRSQTHKFGYENAEPHYLRIKPCIIAEQLLDTNAPEGLVDYKIWCLDGKPYCIFVCVGRNPETHHAEFMVYDLDWNRKPEFLSDTFRNESSCPKPDELDEMLSIAEKLAKGHPQARVDLYNIDGKIYFGEMTMSSNFGMMPYFTQEVLDDMGAHCTLPKRSLKEKVTTFIHRWTPLL